MRKSLDTIIYTLAEFLRERLPDVQVIEEWPHQNVELAMPSVSIVTVGNPELINIMPTELTKFENGDAWGVVYQVGQYNLNIQIDLWTEYKEERFELIDKVLSIVNSQFIENEMSLGLSLELDDYHGAIARYDVIGYNYMDDSESSSRSENRAMINVLAVFPRLEIANRSLITKANIQHEVESNDTETKDVF